MSSDTRNLVEYMANTFDGCESESRPRRSRRPRIGPSGRRHGRQPRPAEVSRGMSERRNRNVYKMMRTGEISAAVNPHTVT